MSKSKMKKSANKAIKNSQTKPGKSAREFVTTQAKVAAVKAKEIPLPTLTFTYGANLVHHSLRLLQRNIESSVIIFVLPSLLMILGVLLTDGIKIINGATTIGYGMVGAGFVWFVSSIFATYPFSLAVARGEQPSIVTSYKDGFYFAPRLVGLALLLFPLIVLGACLAIVPGFIIIRRYCLAFYYIVDQDADIREAMQLSASQTRPLSSAVYGMIVVFSIIFIIANAFSRTLSPYGTVMALIVETLYLFAPAVLYYEIQLRNKATRQSEVFDTPVEKAADSAN